MLKNYLTVAWRALRRRPGFSALNVVGLAAGLACVILIGLWVLDELSYDDFHPNADRTYRVLREWNTERLHTTIAGTPSALAPTLKQRYAQVEAAVRIEPRDHLVERGERASVAPNALYADPGFFEMFGFDLRRGTARLDEPATVVLTPDLADQYFPDTDPIGKTLRVNEQRLTVTGIAEAPPQNTHLDYSLVASLSTRSPDPSEWGLNFWRTYVTLSPGTDPSVFEETFAEVVRSYKEDDAYADEGRPHETYHLQPVTGIHLGIGLPANFTAIGSGPTGSLTYLYLFAALAVFVLGLACINFINLSTARSARRANEVGVRKAMGADRRQLAGQFLGESLLLTTLGLIFAIGLCAGLMPVFNDLTGKSIARSALVGVGPLLAYGGLLVVVGVLAGTYPAFILSGYEPIDTLRTQSSSSRGSPRLRQALVVFQFAISIALLVGTAVVHQQVSYMTTKDLGFREENLLVVNDEARSLRGQVDAVKQALESKPGIQAATSSYSVPGRRYGNRMWGRTQPEIPAQETQNANFTFVGYDYVETLQLDLAAGRDFSRDHPTDTAAVMINEAALQKFGYASPEAALGDTLVGETKGPIIGVVENFHYESLHEQIYPLVMAHEAQRLPRQLVLRVAPGQTPQALRAARDVWQKASPLPMTYSFLADELAAQYEAERRLETLFLLFAALAVLIACLGLFGLAAYAAQQRTQEIGLRKALGATATQIVGLLSRNFLALVGIAFLVAVPVAYVGLQQWLANFAYHINLGIGVFALAGLLATLIASLSVSYQAWTAAQADPARTLRND